MYTTIFQINQVIEGLAGSTSLTPSVKQQLEGEAKFMRAFSYFYLVNLYGDVPLVTTTDYKANALMSRTPAAQVYEQIIDDLTSARDQLSTSYLDGTLLNTTTERVRPTKWAAEALLSRVYLYTKDFANAETSASAVINNSTLYNFCPLNDVFLKNSSEAIWQLQVVYVNSTHNTANTGLGARFILPPTGPAIAYFPFYLSDHVTDNFEANDQRRTSWVSSVTVDGNTYNFPYKYKAPKGNTTTTEYPMMIRYSELYLIRAEARAELGKISDAQDDLNAIRNRVGLANTTAANTPDLITAISRERISELFTEWGDRWLTLKRTGTIDAVMVDVTAEKGGSWSSNWKWYPVPLTELTYDPNLVQNEGY